MSQAINDIAAERRRQIEIEGYTPKNDDAYRPGILAQGAAAYAYAASGTGRDHGRHWPWRWDTWKPGAARRMLVKAGALIAAEIERIDRNCTMCDGTGTKDHASFAMDPCDHVRPQVDEVTRLREALQDAEKRFDALSRTNGTRTYIKSRANLGKSLIVRALANHPTEIRAGRLPASQEEVPLDTIHPAPAEFTPEQLSQDQILRYFHYAHLPPQLQGASKPFCDLAHHIVGTLPRNAERTVALRELLEAKDAAVRANVQ